MCCGSAIPIWEFLTRNEKMSYLYSTFGQLVSVHCKATAASTAKPVNECKRDLLAYGYEKLQTFSDAQLDLLDPYQRAANELIWSSIMRNHPSSTLITTRKPLPTPPDSSLIILTHQKPANTAGSTNTHSQNPLFDSEADNKHKFAMDMDITYGYANGQTDNQKSSTETFLSGPLVFRVRPDGSPVEEDQHKPLPHDDDLEAYQLAGTTVGNGATAAVSSAAQATTVAGGQPKHRKIAMISDLKQQHLASLALQRDLQPPFEPARLRRQPEQSVATAGRAIPLTQSFHALPFAGYYYAKGQA